jgi:hypothetical protein
VKWLAKGAKVYVVVSCKDAKRFLAPAGRDKDDHAQICFGAIAPGVRNPSSKACNLAGLEIKYLVPVCDTDTAFKDQEMFVFLRMKMQWRTVTGA